MQECQAFWVCAPNQWRCHTGQCIDRKWLNDSEWDCADGSDEIGKSHIALQLIQMQENKQAALNRSDPLACLNHNTSAFPCLSPHDQRFICLHPHQTGDHRIDCLGAIDERNTLDHCSQASDVLGHHFLCLSTNTCIPFYSHCQPNYRCPNPKDDQLWCDRVATPTSCLGATDFACFDGQCLKNRRCDGVLNCRFAEDEYMCDYTSLSSKLLVSYREKKRLTARITPQSVHLSLSPANASITEQDFDNLSFPITIKSIAPDRSAPVAFVCNRDIGILSSNDSIACFCPPQYYGQFCQYHSDRLLVLLHLNLSQSIYTPGINPNVGIKLLVLFLFEERVLMTHEFLIRPALDLFIIAKKTVHIPYPQTTVFRQHRQDRFKNRSDMIYSHPYWIRIEAYETDMAESLSFKAVWQYPIIYDYLPVFRFSKILHLTPIDRWHPCPYLCSPGFTGPNCIVRDAQCLEGYCASKSLCLPNYRSVLDDPSTPSCLCPANRYGRRCEIVHDFCQGNFCLNGGSCYPSSQPNSAVCFCTKEYRGSQCELRNARLHVFLIDQMIYEGVAVQYFTIDSTSLDLILVHQEVFTKLARSIEYFHQAKTVPEIVLAKTYRSLDESFSDLYLLSSSTNVSALKGTVEIADTNRCPPIQSIFKGKTSPLRYHRVCLDHPDRKSVV